MSLFRTILSAPGPIIFVTALGRSPAARGIFKPDASGVIAAFVRPNLQYAADPKGYSSRSDTSIIGMRLDLDL